MEAGVAVEVLHEGEDLRIVRVEAADGARSLWRIPAAQVVDARSRRRLRREAALLREVAGPGIAELRAVSDDDDEPALIFADPGGELLLSRMRRGELDVDACVELGIRLASALGRLHLQRRVVGGLRPSTILYGADGEVALLDLQRAQLTGGAAAHEAADEDAGEPGDLPWELLLY
ncbi:MAG: hypothetical protein KC486_28760, partial [Myxococcales bacterium]|nr:hypothetical protein [Myxococcales bacterium]